MTDYGLALTASYEPSASGTHHGFVNLKINHYTVLVLRAVSTPDAGPGSEQGVIAETLWDYFTSLTKVLDE